MKPFSLLVKPASADCNLRCEYCFYLDRSKLYPETRSHRMSDEVLKRMVSTYMRTWQPQYAFGWQGGEPTIMGVDFFRRVVELQMKYGREGSSVANGLQTNGTLIDDEFAAHLAKYSFLVGISLDGPQELHDHYRRTADSRGSHADVLRGVECLKRNGVEYNVLTLVNSINVNHGKTVYQYLCDMGILYHQYIPCVEFQDNGEPMPFSVSGPEWGEFLCQIFDEWAQGDTRRVSIRLFDSIVALLVDGTPNVCHMAPDCCQYFVVEHNGDVYPCDFFVDTNRRLGNIAEETWEQIQSSADYRSFGRDKSRYSDACRSCEYLRVCLGDCQKHRQPHPLGQSRLCAGWKRFYQHAMPRFRQLADEIVEERRLEQLAHQTAVRNALPVQKVGRNDPCPCGSGRKYKRCHGAG